MTVQTDPEELRGYSYATVGAMFEVSEATIKREVMAGRLRGVLIGNRARVTPQAIAEWVEKLPAALPTERAAAS